MFKDFFETQTSTFKRNSSQMENKWEHILGWLTHMLWVQGWRVMRPERCLVRKETMNLKKDNFYYGLLDTCNYRSETEAN
jgi:hypothetical protein